MITVAGVVIIGGSGTSGPALSDATPAALGVASAGVSTEASRADHVHALPTGGVDTSLQAAPDTGWTASGNGTASISAGVATMTVTNAQTQARLRRTAPTSPHAPALEMSARITMTSTPDAANPSAWIGLESADGTRWVRVMLNASYGAFPRANVSGTPTDLDYGAFPGGATFTNGRMWFRFVVTPSYVAFFAGDGVTRPTSWTRLNTWTAAVGGPIPLWADGLLTALAVGASRSGGSGDLVVEIADIQWRSLLGAPT